MKILLLSLLILLVSTQRGRGGSSSSGGGSSSSSKGSSSYTGIRPTTVYPVVSSRTYISAPGCMEQCHINYLAAPDLLAACLQVCQQAQLRSNRIFYGILGTIFACCCACCILSAIQNREGNANAANAH